MTTPVKVGARNDIFALKNARRLADQVARDIESSQNEVMRMREAMVRPDYGRLNHLLGKMAGTLARANRELDEMYVIRANAGVIANTDVDERLAALEAQVAELTYKLEQTQWTTTAID